ncbi:MAG: DNA alkylation repair protein [Candidatus Omnitrophica bacterium]|nr:DNA alkylation repair protein [Candidatus Omnitrophota bacterium]
MPVLEIQKQLRRRGNKKKAKILQRFFKTGLGEYGHGDRFLGVTVPVIRKIAEQHKDIPLPCSIRLLKSTIHEERVLALCILVVQYKKSDTIKRKRIYELYLENTRWINNWDLVDLTAPHIVGAYLFNKDTRVLMRLAKSRMLWERRIAIVSTFYFIRHNSFNETLTIAALLLYDKEDLIHKAVGWMLREVGKRDVDCEEQFLREYYKKMPRTMLRYAIERFPERKRQAYLKGNV